MTAGGQPVESVSLIIPAYNEASGIAAVLDDALAALKLVGARTEVLVIDDASLDDTAQVVADHPGVRLLRNPVNLGYGHSLLRGVAAARGDLIAICDADGSYDLSALPDLVSRAREGVDHVIAERTGPRFRRPFLRRTVYRWLCGYVVGTRVPDANSGLRVFRRQIVEDLRADLCLGFSFTTSLTLASLMSGYVIDFRKSNYRARVGHSHVRLRDTFRTAQYLFQLIAAYNPVKLFVPLVGLSVVAGVAATGLSLWRGEPWLLPASLFATAAALLTGLAAHAYVVSRAAAGPIRGAALLFHADRERAGVSRPGSGVAPPVDDSKG
jgi:glycosyltransferase involved in cell wall biosynthesis